ncbi:MAG: hypothetical protein SPJ17_05155 [Anaeroplasma sp.]|uniref:hypothetical protein n=1 Tax=Anaeroplasma sp. TaxID=1872523 RepID=UPI002A9118F1|nr:hypothetical protein [Anaeroplasma sp.]MDY5983063.1 hypothetical protein [Anaeroplasma sp.]
MNKKRILGNILFWTTLISPIVSFSIASMIGEANIFGVAGIIRYSWVMLLFIPIGILSILIGFKLKNSTQKYKKNFIVSFICLPLLIIFGSYRFIFNSVVSYDVNEVSIIEEKINFEIPRDIKVATNKLDLYDISYLKILNSESKDMFEQEVENNQLWQKELQPEIKSLLPLNIQYESEIFEYFVFFNITSNEYNIPPLSGQYECIFIAYDCDLQRLIILNDYKIDIK